MGAEISIINIEGLLLIAALVAMLAARFHFPYTVGLVVTGVLLALLPVSLPLPLPLSIILTKDLIFSALLPPLIFEAALFLRWSELRKELSIVVLMATLGLVLAALVTALGMHWLAGWPLAAAGIFGVLIAATDPVSVIATFKDAGVTGRLRLMVEAESLFNDGTAAVLFALLVALAQGANPTLAGVAVKFIVMVGGGIACGAAVAFAVLYLAGKTTDPLVEITFTTVAAFGSFLLAERFHLSGVLATLTAGLVLGSRGPLGAISEKGRESVEVFWTYAAFVANSLIFLLLGIQEIKQSFDGLWGGAVIAIALVTVGRAVSIYPIAFLFSRSGLRVDYPSQHVMVWGGLRGALALGLALGLPAGLPYRAEIVATAFAVVAFSVIVQGLTMSPLLRFLNLLPRHPDHRRK
jgi:monovalent cation:H+ antiporter, CPA1 family